MIWNLYILFFIYIKVLFETDNVNHTEGAHASFKRSPIDFKLIRVKKGLEFDDFETEVFKRSKTKLRNGLAV